MGNFKEKSSLGSQGGSTWFRMLKSGLPHTNFIVVLLCAFIMALVDPGQRPVFSDLLPVALVLSKQQNAAPKKEE